MKKTVAMLLALIMALSATLALAEPAKARNEGLSLVSSINIDRDKAGKLMDEQKLDEQTRQLVDSALAVVNAASDRLCIAQNGVSYELFLNETEVLCFTFGMTDDGLVALSNLIPGHALTVSNDTINIATGVCGIASEISKEVRLEREAQAYKATAAMSPYFTEFVEDLLPAIQLGNEEKGDFTLRNGKTFNTCMAISLDRQGVADALNNMFSNMLKDSVVLAVLVNALVTDEDLANSAFVAENVPVIDIALYANLDDKGEELSPEKAIGISLTLPGQTEVCASLELCQSEDSVQAMLDIPGSEGAGDTFIAFGYAPYDEEINAGSATLQVKYNGEYYGDILYFGLDEKENAMIATNELYIQDPDQPLATATTAHYAGEPTLDLSIGDRRAIAAESLVIGETAEKLKQELMQEVLFSGLGIIGTATKAVPEFATLLSLLSSAGAEEAAEVEEPETAKDAA